MYSDHADDGRWMLLFQTFHIYDFNPFLQILLVGGSKGLQYFAELRYKYRKVKMVSVLRYNIVQINYNVIIKVIMNFFLLNSFKYIKCIKINQTLSGP